MHLFILGSGTILQDQTIRNCSGYFLDHQFLFDCGPGIWKSLLENQINPADISIICLTHFHIDHTSDLAAILLNRYLQKNYEQKPLKIIGPAGLTEWIDQLATLFGEWIKEMSVQTLELTDENLQIRDYYISSQNTYHTDNSICYRVVNKNKTFFYSGDMDYQPALVPIASSSDLAVIEASNTLDTHVAGHLTPQSAIRFATEAKIKKVLLTHMYPDVLREIDKIKDKFDFPGELLIAKDGARIDF